MTRRLITAVTHKSNKLHSINEVDGKFIMDAEHYLGIRQVEVQRIVGSIARHHDFDSEFNPLHPNSRERWERVAAAFLDDILLPPVELLKVGDSYFVRDGNHRVSVARHYGVEYIDAEVTEFVTPCSLAGMPEHAMFTNLAALATQVRERLGSTITGLLGKRMVAECPEEVYS